MDAKPPRSGAAPATNFIRNIVAADVAAGRFAGRAWNGGPGNGTHQAGGGPDPARIRTRFPPEPNGYLHLGHAKSIFLNFGLARDFGGRCHLRFDDTNPAKEEQEYVDAIIEAVHWLGFDWQNAGEDNLYFASDYFDTLADCARHLISAGLAYVDESSADEVREARGTLTEPGRPSRFRDRPRSESLERFAQMLAGQHAEGSMVLRARIDMAAPNLNLRDPALYRIRFAPHHRTGERWCVYPMYDFAHALSDALESITHSVCTLEFEDHRPLYEWCVERCIPVLRAPQWAWAQQVLAQLAAGTPAAARDFALACRAAAPSRLGPDHAEAELRARLLAWEPEAPGAAPLPAGLFEDLLGAERARFAPLVAQALECVRPDPFALPRQYEFSRLNVEHVVLSKRKLIQLVNEGLVEGWDDPRLPTLAGLRRRGITPGALALFTERIGVSKSDSRIDHEVLDLAVREDLDPVAPRMMAVLEPLRLVLEDVPADFVDLCHAPRHPHRPQDGEREIALRRELWIERDDFRAIPEAGFFRLVPGGRVRLRYAWVIECTGFTADAAGTVQEVRARIVPDTRSGTPGAAAVKVKGAIHWLPVEGSVDLEVRLFKHLFSVADPDAAPGDYRELLDPASRSVLRAKGEAGLAEAAPEDRFQFERQGYFVADRRAHAQAAPVFNRIVTLKDSRGRA
jgi:glutaminyl-tRNA synthetase